MNVNDPNVVSLERVAARLGQEMRQSLVFVGGAVVGLLVTDPAMPAIRSTLDVDLICQALAPSDYYKIEVALRARGFVHDLDPHAPICRWRADAVAVDVMPTLDTILGFSNPWYPEAMDTAEALILPSTLGIRVIATSPLK